MTRPVVGPKFQAEIKNVQFDYTDELTSGVTLASALVVATVISGTDATPGNIVLGSATVDLPTSSVIQRISGGVVGVTYKLQCRATANNGTVHVVEAQMLVQ